MAGKKTLLNEGTIRRFMKLAELAPLSQPFLENYAAYDRDDDAPLPDEDIEAAVDVEMDPEGIDVDADIEDIAPAPAGDAEEMVHDLVTKIADAIRDATGVEVAVETDGETEDVLPMEEPADVEDIEAEVDYEAEGPEDEGGDIGMEELEESEEDLVQEIALRVAKRLTQLSQ